MPSDRPTTLRHLNVALAGFGHPLSSQGFIEVPTDMLDGWRRLRQGSAMQAAVDRRLQAFLDAQLAGCGDAAATRLPGSILELTHAGMARELSLPRDGHEHHTSLLSSYRVKQGVLHNPRNDRRTTVGVFHIAETGPAVPADKKAVPIKAFAGLLAAALRQPTEALRLPFTAGSAAEIHTWVGLLLRPLVFPAVPGVSPARTMEVRFFAPASLVSNLDFVESIFGNGGDPSLPENDAALDTDHWTGHTGCVILAPHLVETRKKDLGLPHWDSATERQRAEGMAWKTPDERYNDGSAFKVCLRTMDGVVVTIIADNYFGYCKKEVKTQIGFAANLLGGCEEEHAGGALARASFNLGEEWKADARVEEQGQTFADVVRDFAAAIDLKPEGYAVDRQHPKIIYVPEDSLFSVKEQSVSWQGAAGRQSLRLRPGHRYLLPHGYTVRFEPHPATSSWRLLGTEAEGVLCHKPCTVSGGGKSEISKQVDNAFIYGPIYVGDLEHDFAQVEALMARDYSDRFKPEFRPAYGNPTVRVSKGQTEQVVRLSRPILSPQRSLGSVIRLFTPSSTEFTDAYNAWLKSQSRHILNLLFVVKRFYKPEWGTDWRKHFSVDIVNDDPGHELRCDGRRLVGTYVRIGFDGDGAWRTYKLRVDFIQADKVQWEDDITASAIIPADRIQGGDPDLPFPSQKLAANCEARLFQRPDEAIHRGFDKQTEADMAALPPADSVFISNFEPLTRERLADLIDDAAGFAAFTAPMQTLLTSALADPACQFAVSSAHPRLVDGKPSKNPRYLQVRPDLSDPVPVYAAEMSARLQRRIALGKPISWPITAILAGRRNNPADAKSGVRALCCYSPIHYQELPELFMEWISSLTGRSPSTTGAGSEGALTKGPFNCLPTTADLNNAFVGMALTGYGGYTTSAGVIGQHRRVDHDLSLLIPEIWCRLPETAWRPENLCRAGHLEKLNDYDFNGRRVLASRLGWRITSQFVSSYFGRVFSNPGAVFDDELLRPEIQDAEAYADSIDNIVEAQKHVAEAYFADGTIALACPPIQILLHIMAHGQWQGLSIDAPEVRRQFTRSAVISSPWYRRRLETQRDRDQRLWKRHVANLETVLANPAQAAAVGADLPERLARARARLNDSQKSTYLDSLVGFPGADPLAP